MRDVVGSFEWELKYNPRQPCLGTDCTLERNFWRSSEEATTEEGGKVGFFFNIVATTIFHPYLQLVVNQLNFATSVHLNCDHLRMFQVRPKLSFWQSHCCQPSQNIIKARVIALVMTGSLSLSNLYCVLSCKTWEVWDLLGRISRKWWREFLANDGANLRELLIISLPAEPVCENYRLLFLHKNLNKCNSRFKYLCGLLNCVQLRYRCYAHTFVNSDLFFILAEHRQNLPL